MPITCWNDPIFDILDSVEYIIKSYLFFFTLHFSFYCENLPARKLNVTDVAGVTSPWHGAGLEEEKSHREVRARAQSHTARQRQGLPDAAGATPQWALVRESVLLGQLIVVGPTARRRRLSSEPLSSGVLAGSPAGSGWMIVVFFFPRE